MTTSPLFDHRLIQQRWARIAKEFHRHDALYDEVVTRLLDRLQDVKRLLDNVLCVGTRKTFPIKAGIVTEIAAFQAENLSFPLASFDAVISVLALHWMNNLPQHLLQIRHILKPDSFFLAGFLGGNTLIELRTCLTQAESEITGGASPRVSPTVSFSDASALLQGVGFKLPVVDGDVFTLTYEHPLALMHDLRGMGETNALISRSRTPLRRDVLARAIQLYQEQFSESDGRIVATFEVIYMAGWSPLESQAD